MGSSRMPSLENCQTKSRGSWGIKKNNYRKPRVIKGRRNKRGLKRGSGQRAFFSINMDDDGELGNVLSTKKRVPPRRGGMAPKRRKRFKTVDRARHEREAEKQP